MGPPGRRGVRVGCFLLLLPLWVLPIWLVLEVGSVRAVLRERAANSHVEANLPAARVYEDTHGPLACDASDAYPVQPAPLPEDAAWLRRFATTPLTPLSAREALRRQYPEWPASRQRDYRMLFREFALAFDADGDLAAVGAEATSEYQRFPFDDLTELAEMSLTAASLAQLRAAQATVRETGEAMHLRVSLYREATSTDALLLPAEDQVVALVAMDPESLNEDGKWAQANPDSFFAQEWYRYKSCIDVGGVSTNALGMRDAYADLYLPPDTARILCIGGSTTDTSNLIDPWPNLLGQRLQEAEPGLSVSVVNCGTPGISSSGHLGRVRDYALLQPDLCIVYEGVNDLLHRYYYATDPPIWRGAARKSWFLYRVAGEVIVPTGEVFDRYLDECLFPNLEVLARTLRALGSDVVFVTVPHPGDLSPVAAAWYSASLAGEWQRPALSYTTYLALVRQYNARLTAWGAEQGYTVWPLADAIDCGESCFVDVCHIDSDSVFRIVDALCPWARSWLAQQTAATPESR